MRWISALYLCFSEHFSNSLRTSLTCIKMQHCNLTWLQDQHFIINIFSWNNRVALIFRGSPGNQSFYINSLHDLEISRFLVAFFSAIVITNFIRFLKGALLRARPRRSRPQCTAHSHAVPLPTSGAASWEFETGNTLAVRPAHLGQRYPDIL